MASRSRKGYLLVLFLVPTFLVPQAHPVSKTIEGIRYAVHSDHTRIVLDLNGRFSYRVVPFSQPERIAINLPGVRVGREVGDFRITGSVVSGVRINRLSWGSQVVLDLKRKASWDDFFLARTKGKPNRIVVDVFSGANESGKGRLRTGVAGRGGGSVARSSGPATRAPKLHRPYVIAVDAGHGGMDPGARGRFNLVEKEVTLNLAKLVARNLNRTEGLRAILIRKRDSFLSLQKRTRIAKEKGADAFVSIHLNSAKRRSARGVELFFLSPSGAADKASKLLSNKRNAARELGLEGLRSEDVLYMVLDVNQQAMMLRSSLLAEKILKSMRRKGLPPTRGIKQRSFAVLKAITMPSVIVETGFLTNHQDARLLKSPKGREMVAGAIADGIVSFFKSYPPPKLVHGGVVVHRVKKGQTLWGISRQYGTSIASIRKANGMGKSSRLRIGQELVILEGNEN